MKLLHVIPSFAQRYGGPIHALRGMAREQARQGHEVTIMTTNIDGKGALDVPLDRAVDEDGVKIFYFEVQAPKWWYFSKPFCRALRDRVKSFDLVHIHSIFLWPTTAAAWCCRRQGVPYIIRPAGSLDPIALYKPYEKRWASWISRVKKWVYLNTLGRWDLGGARAIHFTSQEELDSARSLKLKAPGFVAPLGLDAQAISPREKSPVFRLRYPQLKHRKIILFFSRLDPIKGLDILIEAMVELASRRQDFAWVLAGAGADKYEAELKDRISKSGLAQSVVFIGPVYGEDKRRILEEADIFVLPSYHENFGVAVVEAMAAGLPVVISDRVNIHHEVQESGAGIVTMTDPRQISAAMERLLLDDALRRRMGENGARLVGDRFTWRKICEDMSREYGRLKA